MPQLYMNKQMESTMRDIMAIPFKFDKSIELDDEISFTSNEYPFPLFQLGFTHEYHKSREKVDRTKEFEGKKKVYLVTNKYELEVDNFDNDISSLSKKYFGSVMENEFYEMWEMLFMFDFGLDKKIETLHLGTNNKAFQVAIDKFKQLQGMSIGSDKHFNSSVKIKKADFATSQIDIKYNYINTQEQELTKPLIGHLMVILSTLKKGGSMVIQLWETYTKPTVKLICLLGHTFDKVTMVRPATTKPWHGTKYLVCQGFKDNGKIVKFINKLDKMNNKNGKLKLYDFLFDYQFSGDVVSVMVKQNIKSSMDQYSSINDIVSFIDGQNYHGEEYDNYNKVQIEGTENWVNTFMPVKGDFKKKLKMIRAYVNGE